MTFLDFFSGVGGFRKGFELCGMVCKGHCEIDKFADRSYRAIHDIKEDEWYCYERGFDWGGLYEIFHRVSCWCCPLQSLDELRKLHRRFPDLWQQLETWDDATWRTFIKGYSARDLAVRFDFEERWQKAGGNLRSRAFYAAMREEIQRRRTEVKPCLTSRREMLSRER